MPAVIEGIDMFVPPVDEREGEVFQIAVIGCGANELALRSCSGVAAGNEAARVVQMFYDLGAVDQIERFFVEIFENVFVRREDLESPLRTALPRNPDPGLGKIDAYD
jgi:hypothetical protein